MRSHLSADSGMLALSFLQPWLWAIVEGHKGVTIRGRFLAIENRVWKPHRVRLGHTIALHASAKYDGDGEVFVRRLVHARDFLKGDASEEPLPPAPSPRSDRSTP